MKEAEFYSKIEGQKVRCLLCPHSCLISEGDAGKCLVRKNHAGTLYSFNYGRISSMGWDPVEKKPLYHFYPGRKIFSVGTNGCNFTCPFCQNYGISQFAFAESGGNKPVPWGYIAGEAKIAGKSAGIAFTYNEPSVWYEYVYDVAAGAKNQGIATSMVSNGYISKKPLDNLLGVISAFSIDLKSPDDSFYRNIAGGTLAPVRKTLKAIRRHGAHLEITFLVIPRLNDDEKSFRGMVDWIEGELGNETVLHISRYFPAWKMTAPPTSVSTISRFLQIAAEKLAYVYPGNMPAGTTGSNTACPRCRNIVISRSGYRVIAGGLDDDGNCIHCKKAIAVMA
jgi:pyruvate formate lyase activating enzyme